MLGSQDTGGGSRPGGRGAELPQCEAVGTRPGPKKGGGGVGRGRRGTLADSILPPGSSPGSLHSLSREALQRPLEGKERKDSSDFYYLGCLPSFSL